MRDLPEVIEQIKYWAPIEMTQRLTKIKYNCGFRPPELVMIDWQLTQECIQEFIEDPTEDWEFEILSIFSTVPVADLRRTAQRERKIC
jgi:hypothetical protein